MKDFLILFLLFIGTNSYSQRITGTVFSEKGDLVPYASITVKGSSNGTSANQNGNFAFNLPAGTYTLVCQSIGYVSAEKDVLIESSESEVIFILKQRQLELQEAVVRSGKEDPAYEIIRQAIKKRPFYNNQINSFSCDLYTKDLIRMQRMPDRIFGKKIKTEDKKDMGVDSTGKGIIYLSESISRAHKQRPDKFKMEVISSRVSGSESFGITFPAFITMYTNNVVIFSEKFNPRGFVSPIADAAIHYYKFRFLGNFQEHGKMVHSIEVTPRRAYEPLFSGVINITDEDWRIQSFDLLLTKRNQLELLDTLFIKQLHVPVSDDIWQVKSQVMIFDLTMLGMELAGNFQSVYSNYTVNPVFDKKFFDRIIIKYDTAAHKRDKKYWNTVRPVPLELEENMDYKIKDSLFAARRDSLLSKSHIDSLKKENKIKPWDIFLSGIHQNSFDRRVIRWGFESIIKNLEYNSVEGAVVKLNGYYDRKIRSARLNFEPTFRYGFSNRHFTAFANVALSKNRQSGSSPYLQKWFFSGGKRVSSFNNNYNFIEILRNSVSTLFYGNNFLKIYENYYGNIAWSRSYESGLRFSVSGLYEDRIPLNNTTAYTVSKKDSQELTVNYPYEKISSQFSPHQAFSIAVNVTWKPGQRYIQFPTFKLPLGSKYPTFSFTYTTAIPGIFGSDARYDKWDVGVSDTRNFRLAGTFKYRAGAGGFLNRQEVPIQDFRHFNGNPTKSASEYLNSFQLAGYYTHSTIASFYSLAHVEHHFNGLLTNKIPLFRKLNWNLVAGSNAFYVNPESNYVELFVGIENIFKTIRVDFIAGYQNGIKGVTGIRIGSGGSFGVFNRGSVNRRGNSIEISF